jgi:HSP20 family molecular chaperone IbpA
VTCQGQGLPRQWELLILINIETIDLNHWRFIMTHGFYWTNFSPLWEHMKTLHESCSDLTSDLVTRDAGRDLIKIDALLSDSDAARKGLSSLPNYPHCDCWIDDDLKHLHLEFALAGYKQEELKVSASKNQLKVVVQSANRSERRGMIYHGISKRSVNFSLSIDEAFNVKRAKTTFEDGLLKIDIPRAKDAEIVELM